MGSLKVEKNKGGRPLFEVDYKKLENLCAIFCTGKECASVLGCHYDTLAKKVKEKTALSFPDYFKRNSAPGRVSLREKQFEAAHDGNVTMMIWLGKQILGQKDKSYNEIEDKTPEVKNMTDEELKDRLRELGVDVDNMWL